MLTFKKLRRVLLVSCLLSCGAYVYFVVPTFHTPGMPVGVQPLAPGSFEARGAADLPPGSFNNAGLPPPAGRVQAGDGLAGADPANFVGGDDLRPQQQQQQQQQLSRQRSYQARKDLLDEAVPRPNLASSGVNRVPGVFADEDSAVLPQPGDNSNANAKADTDNSNKAKEPKNPERPWFFQSGSKRPLSGERGNLWPHEDPDSDRIVEQLMFMPLNSSGPLKKIFLQRGSWGGLPLGQSLFLRDNCPVNRCALTDNAEEAHALIFKDRYVPPPGRRHPDQVYILYLLECPMHTPGFRDLGPVFNWTATYRHDSDLVAPYEKWVPYPDVTEDPSLEESPSTASNFDKRTKDVAWFVSNCNARNGRLQFARKLGAYIGVDVFGACSNKKCPRYNKSCFEMLDTTYKFYLAFENSNCKDYITEKFFVNGLNHSVVPIVMGARKSEYVRAAPANSFIHVDDFRSPKKLADHLREISRDRTRWESFLQSRRRGEMINTYFFCRLCAMLHDDIPRKVYPDIHSWWAGPDVCSTRTWKPEPSTSSREPAYKFL